MLFNNKRGISPLVATILLIAFAVSIGALIMNWTSSDINNAIKGVSCSDVNIELLNVCQNNESIVISIKNQGEVNINAITLRSNSITGSNHLVSSSFLSTSETKTLIVKKENFNEANFKILPIIVSGQDELVCNSQAIINTNLPEC